MRDVDPMVASSLATENGVVVAERKRSKPREI